MIYLTRFNNLTFEDLTFDILLKIEAFIAKIFLNECLERFNKFLRQSLDRYNEKLTKIFPEAKIRKRSIILLLLLFILQCCNLHDGRCGTLQALAWSNGQHLSGDGNLCGLWPGHVFGH